jgi:Secretion system C-terminal sorting domain
VETLYTFIFMKKYLFINVLFIVFVHWANAQTRYHSDTLFNDFKNQFVANTIKTPLGYASTIGDLDFGDFGVIYTDSSLHQTHRKEWNVFDSLSFSHYQHSTIQLNNKNRVIIGFASSTRYGGALIEMDSLLQDTIRTKKIMLIQNGIQYNTLFFGGSVDGSGYIWLSGIVIPPLSDRQIGVIVKLNQNLEIIHQYFFDNPTQHSRTYLSFIHTPDGGAITQGYFYTIGGGCTTFQVFTAKVDSICNLVWYKEYGRPNMPDATGTSGLFPSIYPNKFWFIYGEGQKVNFGDTFCQNAYVRLKAVLLDYQGNEYIAKYMTDTLRHTSAMGSILLPDKSIVLGMFRTFQDDDSENVLNFGSLYKFSANMDSIWHKLIVPPKHFPFGHEDTRVTNILQEPNGDFICSGLYRAYDPAYPEVATPWIARIDSTGCGEQACALVPTEAASPSPSQGRENVRVYPNPANDILNIEIPQNALSLYYKIYDVLGRETQSGILESQISLKNLNNGIYYIAIYENNRLLGSQKFVVLHE